MPFQRCKVIAKDVDSKEYHALKAKAPRGSREFVMSPSQMKAFSRLPSRWVRGWEPPGSKSKLFGDLVDCKLLTKEWFEARYAFQPAKYSTSVMECPVCKTQSDSDTCKKHKIPRIAKVIEKPWNNSADECSKWTAEQNASGKTIVSDAMVRDADAAIARLLEPVDGDDTIKRWLGACDRQVLVTGEWLDEETGIIIPVSALIDFVPRADTEFSDCLGDLKTAKSAETLRFAAQAFDYGYHLQAKFDLDLFNAATGEQRQEWCFLVIENFSPWEPNRVMFETASNDPSNPTFLDAGRMAQYGGYEGILAQYALCLKHNRWPGYNSHDETVQGWSIARLDPFKLSKTTFSPKLVVNPGAPDVEGEAPPDDDYAPSDDEVIP